MLLVTDEAASDSVVTDWLEADEEADQQQISILKFLAFYSESLQKNCHTSFHIIICSIKRLIFFHNLITFGD